MTKTLEIYTDGACSGNPGPGGWAAILKYGNVEKEILGNEINTTNNIMELTAAIKALEALKRPSDVDLYTDSQYLKNGMTQWIDSWVKNGWRKSDNKEIKNIDLWQKLYELSKIHKINWHWVKAHANNYYNNKADELAVLARKQAERLKNES